jgi:hypothetical protein
LGFEFPTELAAVLATNCILLSRSQNNFPATPAIIAAMLEVFRRLPPQADLPAWRITA